MSTSFIIGNSYQTHANSGGTTLITRQVSITTTDVSPEVIFTLPVEPNNIYTVDYTVIGLHIAGQGNADAPTENMFSIGVGNANVYKYFTSIFVNEDSQADVFRGILQESEIAKNWELQIENSTGSHVTKLNANNLLFHVVGDINTTILWTGFFTVLNAKVPASE